MVALRRNERGRQGLPTSRRRAVAVDAASGEQSSVPFREAIICTSTVPGRTAAPYCIATDMLGYARRSVGPATQPTNRNQATSGASHSSPMSTLWPRRLDSARPKKSDSGCSDQAIGDSAPRLRSRWHHTATCAGVAGYQKLKRRASWNWRLVPAPTWFETVCVRAPMVLPPAAL